MSGWFPTLGLEAVFVAAGLLGFGYLLADAVLGRRHVDPLVRSALAFPALTGYAFLLMLGHMASGGRVFSHPLAVRAVTAGLAAGLVAWKLVRREGGARVDRHTVLAAVCVVALGLAVWGTPVFRLVPLGAPGADTGWHMGWTNQLLNGDSTPSTLLTGAVPNYYPWMFHALAALVALFTPGGTPFRALGPLQLAQVAGAVVALFALGRQAGRSWMAGAGTALFGAIAAGFGVALIGAVNRAVRTPRAGGPRGTYNAVYNNLAPPLPRDLGYTLFAAFLLLLLVGLERRSGGQLVAAGFVLGLAGLASAEFFFVGLGVAAVVSVVPGGMARPRVAAAVLLPALAVYATWIVPLAVSYVRLGGFVNTTAIGAIVLGPAAILMSWGLATPLGAFAAVRLIPRVGRDPAATVLLATLVAAVLVLLAAAAIPRFLGAGFTIVGRASRYWPVVHLALAVLAGLGVGELMERAIAAGPALAVGAAAAALALVLPLPLDVSLRLPGASPRTPQLAAAILGRDRTVFDALASGGRRQCVMVTPPAVGFFAFGYTGYRSVAFQGDPAHRGNAARIRWRDIYQEIPGDAERAVARATLLDPPADPAAWSAAARRYGVNLVAVERSSLSAGGFHGLPEIDAGRTGKLAVFRVSSCPGP